MATSTPASASSPANINPVGPPPATTTACSVNKLMPLLPIQKYWLRPKSPADRATLRHEQGLAASPRVRYILKWGEAYFPFASQVFAHHQRSCRHAPRKPF